MRILFMGTPDFAEESLKALINDKREVVGVVTNPDKPKGRGHKMMKPPVKEAAEAAGIPVFQPLSLKNGELQPVLNQLQPDIICVVAYGKILPKEILELPAHGCVNGHASLLPKYRGASPIQWCIVCGEKETGVTVMQMDEGMDTGDIISTARVEIGDEETAEELFERLSVVSAELMNETLVSIQNGTATRTAQCEVEATYAPILKKEMAQLDFNNTAEEIYNAVRGYYSWPCAYFFLEGKRVKVIKCRVCDTTSKSSGTVIKADNTLVIACGDGSSVELITVQPEGGRPMNASDMLRGWKIAEGTVISKNDG